MNPGTECSETDFGAVAPFYSGRAPYVPEFFTAVVDALALPKDAFVVDLACGTGELASGFSPHVRAVLAIDKSVGMLSMRPKNLANVAFVKTDLTSEPLQVREQADLVAIGRAIHFFDKERLLPILEQLTKDRAAVLVCGAGMTRNNAWYWSYCALLERYGWSRTKTARAVGLHVFIDTHWFRSEDILIYSRVNWGLPEFLRHALSYSSVSKEIASEEHPFQMELERILAPYLDKSRHLDVEQVNWATPYRRSHPDAGRFAPAGIQFGSAGVGP